MCGIVAHNLSGLGWSPMEVTDETVLIVTIAEEVIALGFPILAEGEAAV